MQKFKKTISRSTIYLSDMLLMAQLTSGQALDKAIEKNKELGRSFVETAMNAKSANDLVATINRIYASDFINHNPMVAQGREGLINFVGAVGASFPGSKATVKEIIANKEKVIVVWTFEGILTGKPFLGVPATGQKVKFDVIDWWTVKNGQLYEHWDQIDWTTALVQLGVKEIPEPFTTIAAQKLK